jgi:hypothetical protein
LLNSFKFCPLQLYSFNSGYSFVVIGKDCFSMCVGGEGIRYYKMVFFPTNIAYHFFTNIKLIHTLVYQSLNSNFFLCFLKYKSFSNCEQSYHRNIFIYLHFTPTRVKQYSNTNNNNTIQHCFTKESLWPTWTLYLNSNDCLIKVQISDERIYMLLYFNLGYFEGIYTCGNLTI